MMMNSVNFSEYLEDSSVIDIDMVCANSNEEFHNNGAFKNSNAKIFPIMVVPKLGLTQLHTLTFQGASQLWFIRLRIHMERDSLRTE